jgi:hypothetical protein
VAINAGDESAPAPAAGTVLRHTHDPALTGAAAPGTLQPGHGFTAIV